MLTIDSTDVVVVATLLGCEPGHGLVNIMNELRATWPEGTTYGQMYRDVLLYMLSKHR